jgi:hypothetical protein
MITVRLDGGLGNQLFQLAAAHHFAKQSRREFHVYSLESPRTVHSNAQYFDTIFTKFRDFYRSIQIPCRCIQENAQYRPAEYCAMIAEYPYHTILLDGYFQKYWYVDDSFLDLLTLDTSILAKYPDIGKHTFVHIRGGDYLRIPNALLDLKQYYKTAFKKCADETMFYIFTNDRAYASQFVEDIPHTFVDENELDSLVLMRECARGICTNSSYSWWGAFLRRNRPIYIPFKWTNEQGAYNTGYKVPGWNVIDW